ERGNIVGATNLDSTKMMYGALGYLERGRLRLVSEAVNHRHWWMVKAPHLAKPLEIKLPLYSVSAGPRWILKLSLYQWLARNASLGKWRWSSREELLRSCPDLRPDGLQGAFIFYDGQMDGHALGLWAAEKAAAAGGRLHTNTLVKAISEDRGLAINGSTVHFDRIVNATGPWARKLLDDSGIVAQHELELLRGSHILLNSPCTSAFLLQVPTDNRICFALPYQGKTLVGTTEVRQQLSDPIRCSSAETDYLLNLHDYYFPGKHAPLCAVFSGLRSLARSNAGCSNRTREYAI